MSTKYGIKTGIDVQPSVPGLIPFYYEMAAAKEANYQFYGDWRTLAPDERAALVAHYFAGKLIESHSQDAVSRAMQPKGGGKGGRKR